MALPCPKRRHGQGSVTVPLPGGGVGGTVQVASPTPFASSCDGTVKLLTLASARNRCGSGVSGSNPHGVGPYAAGSSTFGRLIDTPRLPICPTPTDGRPSAPLLERRARSRLPEHAIGRQAAKCPDTSRAPCRVPARRNTPNGAHQTEASRYPEILLSCYYMCHDSA